MQLSACFARLVQSFSTVPSLASVILRYKHTPHFAFTSHIYPVCQSICCSSLPWNSDYLNRSDMRRTATTSRRAGVSPYLYAAHEIAESRNSRAGWSNGRSGRRGKVQLFWDEPTLCSFCPGLSDGEEALEARARRFVASISSAHSVHEPTEPCRAARGCISVEQTPRNQPPEIRFTTPPAIRTE